MDQFEFGEHTITITVRDVHGVIESQIIPFQPFHQHLVAQ